MVHSPSNSTTQAWDKVFNTHSLWVTLIDLFCIFESSLHDFEASKFDHMEDTSLINYVVLPNIDLFDSVKITITNKSFQKSYCFFFKV